MFFLEFLNTDKQDEHFTSQNHPYFERKSRLKLAKFGCNLPQIYKILGMCRIPIKFGYRSLDISVFEIGETGVKTFKHELKSCLTGLTSWVDCKLH